MNSREQTRVSIVGASGYTGGELIRILNNHQMVELSNLYSRSYSGKHVGDLHEDLYHLDHRFTDEVDLTCDILFLCLGHGASGAFLAEHEIPNATLIIDLSNEYRLDGDHDYLYGLPELNRSEIRSSKRIANPGCFATSIQLCLLPLAAQQELPPDIHVHAITGSTGAGKSLRETTHFTWRNNNVSIYKAFSHQHLAEILRSVNQLQQGPVPQINFVPIRGNFPRGILASVYLKSALSEAKANRIFETYYRKHPFVSLIHTSPNIKQVVNTNNAVIQVKKHGDQLHLIAAIDNLVKGASGQAVQNMNLALGFEESCGLRLKSLGL